MAQFPWLKEVAGSYVDPAIANGAKNITDKLSSLLRHKKGFTLDKVMANVKNDFARPNLFEVHIDKVAHASQEAFRINCYQAQIPGTNIATLDRDVGFRAPAYQKLFADTILGFYSSGDLRELQFFQAWIDKIVNPKNNHFGYYSDYTGRVRIKQLTRKGNLIGTWTLHDAFPKAVDPIQLDYGTTDTIMTVNVTMTYRHFTADFPMAKVKDGNTALPDTYARSSNTAMNKIDPMWEIENEGWKFGQNYQGADASNFDVGPDED